MITNNEKEAIDIVVDMIDKRLNWLSQNEPNATTEIKDFITARVCVDALEHLDLD